MIAYLCGTLTEKAPTRAVIEAGGVGYEVFIPLSTYERLGATGSAAKLMTAHVVREDDELLFGFATAAERTMFAALTSVGGVGPKIALAILSGFTVADLALVIAAGEAKRIAAVKGVGKKTAEKICIELRDKVGAFTAEAAAAAPNPALRDAMLALGALGFAEETARSMAAEALARSPGATTEDIVRLALKGRVR